MRLLVRPRFARTRPLRFVPAHSGFGDGYDTFGLIGNENYNGSVLKDGTPITGAMETYLTAYTHWRDNQGTADATWNLAGSSVLGATDAYHAARRGQAVHDSVMRMFRLTGDLLDLDALCVGFDALQANLKTAWDGLCSVGGLIESCCAGNGNPYSPYLKLNGAYAGGGTDLNRLNQMKLWQLVAEFTWALHLNQNKASPGGLNYGTRLTYWKARLEDFVKAWSEDTTACWAVNNYKGTDGAPGSGITNVTSYRERQSWGLYPFAMRNEGHAGLNSLLIHRYVGLLGVHAGLGILNPEGALTAASEMAAAARANAYIACSNADHGASLVNPHGTAFHATTDPQRATYLGYQGGSLISMWLTGAYRTAFPTSDMTKIGSAFAWAHDGTTGLTYLNLVRGVATCGFTAGSGSVESATANSLKGYAALPIVFDPGGTKMTNIANSLMAASGGSTADRAAIPSARFLREALLSLGEVAAA